MKLLSSIIFHPNASLFVNKIFWVLLILRIRTQINHLMDISWWLRQIWKMMYFSASVTHTFSVCTFTRFYSVRLCSFHFVYTKKWRMNNDYLFYFALEISQLKKVIHVKNIRKIYCSYPFHQNEIRTDNVDLWN